MQPRKHRFLSFRLGRRLERFRPVYLEGDRLLPSEAPMGEDLRDRIKIVLAFYDVAFLEDREDRLWIASVTARDLDLLWNYTSKANDPEWLAHHHLHSTSGNGR
jgi:hypothetical protein